MSINGLFFNYHAVGVVFLDLRDQHIYCRAVNSTGQTATEMMAAQIKTLISLKYIKY